MNNYFKYTTNLNYFALLLFVFWLPLKDSYFPTIITFWMFTWLLEGNIKEKFVSFSYNKIYIAFLLYFLLTIIALLYTNDIDAGLFDVQEKLSIAFFPIILAGSNQKIKNNYNTILFVFVIANVVASFYCLANALVTNIIIENATWHIKHWVWDEMQNIPFWEVINLRSSNFSYTYLSIFKGPAYFAMYITFSISILIYFLKKKIAKKTTHKILTTSTITFFTFMVYLLQSSAGLITIGVVLLFSVLYELKAKQKKKYILIGSTLVLLGVMAIIFSKTTQKRIKDFTDVISAPSKSELFKKDDRLGIWYSAVEVIKENIFIGTSPANLSDELAIKYKKHNLMQAHNEKLNAHNQYLESFAGLGILGFLCLVYILANGFIIAYKKKNYLLFFLLIIVSSNFLFESMLNRMAGVLFLMFFYSLFVFTHSSNKT
ncbi:MAG: hypothetical protein B6I20_14715 [Bacteroidetes bacterium 4572_117]|nr:MAG: hypothetical protein B6I20_14715 [Bacteroidetes bacterium 4572_117]